MKKIVFSISIVMLIGCSSAANKGGGFYTWVDASGNIHTESREAKGSANKEEVSASSEGDVKENQTPVIVVEPVSQDSNAFNPADFKSSELVDAQLAPKRLYSWQDQGAQITQEFSSLEGGDESSERILETKSNRGNSSYEHLAQDRIFYFYQIMAKELKLEEIYLFNKKINNDYLLIEMPTENKVKGVLFKSFIKNNKIALPNVVFLSDRYDAISLPALPFSNHVGETWSAHGYMQGVVEIPSSASYMLILANPNSGVLQLGGDNVKAVDLGSIFIDAYSVVQ